MEQYDVDLSIAQVEAELRAAEAYLVAATARTVAPSAQTPSPYEQAEREAPILKRVARSRAAISDDRRREILAKLSSERQATIRGGPDPDELSPSTKGANTDFRSHSDYQTVEREGELDELNQTQYYGRTNGRGIESEDADDYDAYEEDNDDGEVFYASDVVGKAVDDDIQPRSALDLFASGSDGEEEPYSEQVENEAEKKGDTAGEFDRTIPTDYRRLVRTANRDQAIDSTPGSVLPKLFATRDEWYMNANVSITSFLGPRDPAEGQVHDFEDDYDVVSHRMNDPSRSMKCVEENFAAIHPEYADATAKGHDRADSTADYTLMNIQSAPTANFATSSRIEKLAAPRTHVFAGREKQRLLREMEELKECTFRPTIPKQSESFHHENHKTGQAKMQAKSVHFNTRRGTTGIAFPWLTLSPRQRSASSPIRRCQTLIDRLNLDVTVKYEAREQLRRTLEAEKMRECTFQPKINPVSRQLLSRTDYKPIHERVGEIQREKSEYIQRMREELAYEDSDHTFTPRINPRSREIAETVLCEKQISKARASTRKIDLEDESQVQALLKPPRVTDRLAQEAEELTEKRVAVQEYYDALTESAFTPKISEASTRLVDQRPEFKLDFLSRQEYFRMVEQEKLEALEDVVYHEQELTFRPNIGNASKVLREMRPELAHESSQQRIHRLTYHEPRRSELYRQRLREQADAQLTFKPVINSVSKALAEKAKSEVATQATKRHELQRYFAGKQFRSRVAKELELTEIAQCTFRPHLLPHPKRKSSSTSKLLVNDHQQHEASLWRPDNILRTIETQRQSRAEALQAKRNALELRELEHCTFQPNVHRQPRRPSSDSAKREEKPVVVRGLERFLELKERAKRQREDLKQREQKVFQPHHSYEPRSYTVPKPFKLSKASKDSIRRRLKVREELRSKERTECTFAPQTLEGQQRKVLRTLLQD